MPFQHMPARKTPRAAFENRFPGVVYGERSRTMAQNHDVQKTSDNQTENTYQYRNHIANGVTDSRRNIYRECQPCRMATQWYP